MIDKLLIIGPSSDLVNFSKGYFEEKRQQGYILFSYSDSISYLEKINVAPDYWTFVDPFTLRNYYERFDTDFFKQVTMIVPNMYEDEFKKFFEAGFTCNNLKRDPKLYELITSLSLKDYFKDYISLEYVVEKYSQETPINREYNLREENYVFKRERKNQCKFSHNLLPLLIYYFKSLSNIHSIGFGHYELDRYIISHKRGYPEYVESYDIVKGILKDNLNKFNIKMTFEGAESHFHNLS